MTLDHTLAELNLEITLDRKARGEPEEGYTASRAEERRFLRRFQRGLLR